jgi:hypothetical protein
MALPGGLWLSHLKGSPGDFPDDGVLAINEPSNNKFDGFHFRQESGSGFKQIPIENGVFTPASGGNPDKMEFTEVVGGVTYKYHADIREIRPGFFVTDKGKRSPTGPSPATDDDWVGTHTT